MYGRPHKLRICGGWDQSGPDSSRATGKLTSLLPERLTLLIESDEFRFVQGRADMQPAQVVEGDVGIDAVLRNEGIG